ncbi:DoxX family protein [Nonomuraea jiangxiensis]|uniref:DoxX-like family protein n=1 Tax=Nonomuraea jiangxiensis TaxID=633440 RepID=A0A1G8K273_9ACTN|nr:DoxX family protein [Nonomuraea jiangxiensis]SDI37518.1 DoxX-like family protein [Nonomuraea jiangxiensis]
MDVFLWVLQVLLAVAFIAAGAGKLTQPKERLQPRMPYVEDFSQAQIRGIGAVEVLGGLGVVVPWLTGIAPVLTPLAAAGLGITMILAAAVHRRRKENFTASLVLLAMAVIVAVGRF